MRGEIIDPNNLLLAAEAIAEDRGYEAAIDELWAKHQDLDFKSEQPRNAILHVIGLMKRRHAEHDFYEFQVQEAANA